MHVSTTVNGRKVSEDVEPRMLLVHLLRDRIALTGTHIGCETSYCGACTVLVDGRAVKSCTMLAVQADGAEVTTIEGLANGDDLHPLQEAFSAHHGLQCGFCTPGMILAAVALLADDSNPTDHEIRVALDGNLCRCTGYEPIIRAVEDAAARMRGESPAPAEWETERPSASVAGKE
jgi:carbon-monoxide dehydrogenase small subunit